MPVKTIPEKRKINRFGQKQKQAAIKLEQIICPKRLKRIDSGIIAARPVFFSV
jgi:hypothetical protein